MSKSIIANGCKYDTQGNFDCPKVIEGFCNGGCGNGCKCDGDECKQYIGTYPNGFWGKNCGGSCSCGNEPTTRQGNQSLLNLLAERDSQNDAIGGKWDSDDDNDEITDEVLQNAEMESIKLSNQNRVSEINNEIRDLKERIRMLKQERKQINRR